MYASPPWHKICMWCTLSAFTSQTTHQVDFGSSSVIEYNASISLKILKKSPGHHISICASTLMARLTKVRLRPPSPL